MKRIQILSSALAVVLSASCACIAAAETAEVTDTAVYQLPHSTYVVLRGTARLPSEGLWHVRSAATVESEGNVVAQLYLIPPKEAERKQIGRRMSAALRETRTDQGRWKVRSVYVPCRDFARGHDGDSPESFDDFDKEKHRHILNTVHDLPRDWTDSVDVQQPTGPLVALIKAKFIFADKDSRRVDRNQRQVLAVELRPYVNDGEHWVLYTDGRTLREPIDEELVRRNKLLIRPMLDKPIEEVGKLSPTLRYTVVAVRDHAATRAFDVTFFNSISGDETTQRWNPAEAPTDNSVAETLRAARRYAWQPYLHTGPAPMLRSWLAASESRSSERPTARPGDNLTMFSILGGRAAIEETLQLQNLNVVKKKRTGHGRRFHIERRGDQGTRFPRNARRSPRRQS